VLLGAVLILYVYCAWRVGPVSNFGVEGDDAVYFASAKALASGQGYILPSFPVRLSATRYPELYPLLLAGIWKLDPRFPSNVNWAVAVTLAFGCAALLFAFLLLRGWPGFSEWDALGVVALCAFSAQFLDLSASVLTDVPFMALLLGAIWMAERSARMATLQPSGDGSETHTHKFRIAAPGASDWAVMGAGALAGVSVGFRTLGAAIVAGIGLVLLMRRSYRKLLWFSLAAAPIAVVMVWPQLVALAHPKAMPLPISEGGNGWTQTLCYYTSYACELRMDISGPAALWAVVRTNLWRVFEEPGLYLLFPLGVSQTFLSTMLIAVVSAVGWVGMVRYARRAVRKILPVVFILYLFVIVPWPYTPDRFLVPFLPFLFGGLWLEGRHIASLVRKTVRESHRFSEKAIAVGMATAALVIAAVAGVNYVYSIPSAIAGLARGHQSQLAAERGAYAWIRKHTAPDARIISGRAELVYLYADRRSIPAIIGSTQSFYEDEPAFANQDLAHFADVARTVGASYWLALDWDFALDSGKDRSFLEQKQNEALAGAPVVYDGAGGAARIFDVRCLTKIEAGCEGMLNGAR
jgi:hypothetical protein